MLAIWALVPLPFLNPSWISASSQFTYCWSFTWRILSINFASMRDECNYAVVWTLFCIAFLWDWNENWPLPVLWWLLSFQICWHNEWGTFTASSFRIWSSSTGIPLPPLALFMVMLPKAHLTSHSRMVGSKWVITSSWLFGSWRSFLYHFSVYSCHLLISSASIRSIPFLSFTVPIFAWCVSLVSLTWGDLKSFPFYCFPLFLCIDYWERLSFLSMLFFETLHSNGHIFPFLLCLSLLFFSQLFVRPPLTIILPFCIFFLGIVLPPGWLKASGLGNCYRVFFSTKILCLQCDFYKTPFCLFVWVLWKFLFVNIWIQCLVTAHLRDEHTTIFSVYPV